MRAFTTLCAFLAGFVIAWLILLPSLIDWQIHAAQLKAEIKRLKERAQMRRKIDERKRIEDPTTSADWWKKL